MAQCSAVCPLETAQRDEIHGHVALNDSTHDDASMRTGRGDMHEPALRKWAFIRRLFRCLLVFLRKNTQRGVVERGVVLRRALESAHIPSTNHGLHDARQLGLRIARVPDAEHE